MIISAATRAYVCAQPVDMRKAIDGLAQLVEPLFQADPFSGAVFVFLSRTRNKAKLLVWNRHGFWLLYKRLECGQFPKPEILAQRGLSGAELMAFLEGIDVSDSRSLKRVLATRIS